MKSQEDRTTTEYPVISDLALFDRNSGSFAERLIFNHRLIVIAICIAVTIVLAFQAARIQVNASFEKMIPTDHPYIKNYLENAESLKGLGNSVRIIVEAKNGDILNADYLKVLQKINDEVYLIPGVERAYMKSLWTSSTRWMGVTEEGLDGGPVMPDDYEGSPRSIEQVRANIARSGEVGQLVAEDQKSSALYVPIKDVGDDGKALDYKKMSDRLERIRIKHQDDRIQIHIIGFVKLVGSLIDALLQVGLFFLFAVLICTTMVFWFNRDLRSTALVVLCSMVAILWQLGLLNLMGYALDPYSILVPFLVFAIGMSHGTQKMNGILQDIGRGTHRLIAARYTFRRLFSAGLTALLCDAVGFAVLIVIRIKVIQDLAVTASIGVGILVFTNLVLLPILLSYCGVSRRAALRAVLADEASSNDPKASNKWRRLAIFTDRRVAAVTLAAAVAVGIASYLISLNLKIGDLDPGAPELRAESQYNLDVAYSTAHYSTSSDVFVTMVKTPPNECVSYDTQMRVDAMESKLRQVAGVVSTNSLADLSRSVTVGMNEGNPKWFELIPNESILGNIYTHAPRELSNQDCTLLAVFAYLKDHKADTLSRVVASVEAFKKENNTDKFQVMLAAGNAGIEAATNIVVGQASREMLLLIYGAVTALCFIALKSWRAVLVAMLPLVLTSILCEALMVVLGIGVKVATLPVIALGVGIGVDYALYVLSVTLTNMERGEKLEEAYVGALEFTGKVVFLTGLTLGAAVLTWVFSPIKFQADMGALLAFMFVWNMLGALILLPALASFLLRDAPSLRSSNSSSKT